MSGQSPDDTPGQSKSEINLQPEPEPEPESEPETFKTSHFYNDGNIIFDIRGTAFKVHKSILALHSEVFNDMFELAEAKSAETRSQDAPVSLDDDPKAFDLALNAIYKGVEFIRGANIIQLMDVITITHKYQMSRLEDLLQEYIIEAILPSSAANGVQAFGFHHYDQHPGLAIAVLRLGADELAPWAFYNLGMQFLSKIEIGDTSTYGPTPTWTSLDSELTYSFLVLQRIAHEVFGIWDKIMGEFYMSTCSRSGSTTSRKFGVPPSPAKCTRQPARYDSSSPLYIPIGEKRVDPVKQMAPRIKRLTTTLTEQKDPNHSGWCLECNTAIKELAPSVLSGMYLLLVDCVTRMDRIRPRCS